MTDGVQATTTLFNKDHGADEHDNVINEAIKVQDVGHPIHQLILDKVQRLSVIFETESLVLVLDERLPAPEGEAKFLLPGYLVMIRQFPKLLLDLLD